MTYAENQKWLNFFKMVVIWYYRMQSKISIKFILFYYSWFWMTSLIEFMKWDIFEWPLCSFSTLNFYDTRILNWSRWPFISTILYVYSLLIRRKTKELKLNDCCIFRYLLLTIEIIDNDIANLQNECNKPKKKLFNKFSFSYIVSSNICPLPILSLISITNFCVKC